MFNGNVNSRNETGLCLQVRKRMGEKKEEKKRSQVHVREKKFAAGKKGEKRRKKNVELTMVHLQRHLA